MSYFVLVLSLYVCLFKFMRGVACGILVLQSGTEPAPLAVEVWSLLNHWIAREVPCVFLFVCFSQLYLILQMV